MKSYAQNFEDVLLWRALRDVSPGFYVDLGAQHPILDSVSRWFYERGWRGIHVEPLQLYADLLRQDRPDEEVIQAAISEEPGDHVIYAFPDTGLSTMSADIATTHKTSLGREWHEEVVSSLTLAELFERAGRRDVHWLKVDVEGHERSALASWGESSIRPWIVLVESTYPNTQMETHQEWEFLLTSRGYSFVYADGLNRYYLHETHERRREHFRYPPNYFDHFSLGDHWATHELRMTNEQSLQQVVASLRHDEDEKEQALVALREAREQSAERDERFISTLSDSVNDLAMQTMEQVAQIKTDLASEISRSHEALEKRVGRFEARMLEVYHTAGMEQKKSHEGLVEDIRQVKPLVGMLHASLDENAQHLQAQVDRLSSDFKSLDDALHRATSSRWVMLKALLRPRKEGLLARGRISNTRALPCYRGAPWVAPEQKAENHTQGPNSLTEEALLPAITLGDLYALPPAEFVKVSYRTLLGRETDEGGLSHYLGKLARGDSRAYVLRNIIKSKEYQSRARHEDLMDLSDEDFVDAAYRRVLGRGPDDGGRSHYLERLRSGKAKARILKELASSQEARSRSHPMLRLRGQIEASLRRRYGGRFDVFRRRAARRMGQLDFTLSTAIHRFELDLERQVSALRADMGQLTRILAPGMSSMGQRAAAEFTSRRRWVPREVQLARRIMTSKRDEESVRVHPDFLALADRMRKEAPFGELRDAKDGQYQVDDFLEGACAAEDHGHGPVRWIGQGASVYLRVTAPRFNVLAAGFFEDRTVLVLFGDVVIGTLRFGKEQTVAELPVQEWVGQEIIVRLKCTEVFNPAVAGISSDQRDLGLLIRSMYFD